MNNAALLSQLPAECQALSIEPRHKVALNHFLLVDGTVWVVLLAMSCALNLICLIMS